MQVPEVDEEIELKDDLIKSKITLPEFRADGASRHVAVALFNLEATIRRNELDTCTSVPCVCVWIKRKRLEENPVPMKRLNIQNSEYRKEHKDYIKPIRFLVVSVSL
ncbi:hypothetical protein P5673_026928 [Acropora cervicornis]|uniref:Uncharacterized protein n=1 Tax=Acropora cervicornis TaxID=6130 RepID=A0AAD9Q099_ACRCE|nr:hypothetical protein P5673_026928 [Acropora cervicornis]